MHTRRAFLFFGVAPTAAAGTETPRNKVARLGNEFLAQWGKWAEAFNRTEPGTVDAQSALLFEPLPEQWRRFERAMRAYLRG